MGILNIEGAKLSPLQNWIVIGVVAVTSLGSLGVSVLRENKAVTNIQDTRDAVIKQGVEIEYLKQGQVEILAEQARLEEDAVAHREFAETVFAEVEGVKQGQRELISLGQFYLRNQDSLTRDQMRILMDEMVKKNDWTPFVGIPFDAPDLSAYLTSPSNQ